MQKLMEILNRNDVETHSKFKYQRKYKSKIVSLGGKIKGNVIR